MTRKDCVRFAAMLHYQHVITVNTDKPKHHRTAVIVSVIHATADIFANDNPHFDRAKFLKACGVES